MISPLPLLKGRGRFLALSNLSNKGRNLDENEAAKVISTDGADVIHLSTQDRPRATGKPSQESLPRSSNLVSNRAAKPGNLKASKEAQLNRDIARSGVQDDVEPVDDPISITSFPPQPLEMRPENNIIRRYHAA